MKLLELNQFRMDKDVYFMEVFREKSSLMTIMKESWCLMIN
ncbi:hypothetical protein QKW52_10275 [Bacillus sonorensis]|nr:hypothetical protein [Bacillus sonorensis]